MDFEDKHTFQKQESVPRRGNVTGLTALCVFFVVSVNPGPEFRLCWTVWLREHVAEFSEVVPLVMK